MAEIARTLGVTAASLITETQANRTSAQGSAVARIARDYNVRSVLLVTGPTHMLRACLVFKKHGFDVIPAPTMVPKVETIVIVTPDRVLGRIGALGPVLYEYAALTLYWWRGWV